MNAGLREPIGYQPLTLTSGLRAAAARTPSKVALVLGEERRRYKEVLARVNRIANLSLALGLGPGRNAAILSPNSMEYLEIVAGVSDTGAAIATPNPRLTAADLAAICNDSKSCVLFVHPDAEARLDRALMPSVRQVIRIGSELEALMARASDRFEPPSLAETAIFSIPYTSGTTGKPKGVMLPHRSRTLAFLSYAAEYGIYSPDDHFLAIAPMCHGAGFAYAFCALFMGGTTHIVTRFDPELVLRLIHAGEVTGLFTVPTHHHDIFDLEPRLLESLRGHRLRGIVANAAPLSDDLKQQIVGYYGEGLLHETYGSTEAGVVTNLRPADQLSKSRCVGQAFLGNRIRLLGETGEEVAVGEVGELHSISTCLFGGYWGMPEQTQAAFRDGWVSVGDMARRDEEGFYYIVDRKKDMVISGGVNIYPREIEAVLDAHPSVRESAVIGVPDARRGENLVAYVVPAEPGTAPDFDLLDAHCRERLARYKLPERILLIAELPRNASGKILKTELRALHRAAGEPS